MGEMPSASIDEPRRKAMLVPDRWFGCACSYSPPRATLQTQRVLIELIAPALRMTDDVLRRRARFSPRDETMPVWVGASQLGLRVAGRNDPVPVEAMMA